MIRVLALPVLLSAHLLVSSTTAGEPPRGIAGPVEAAVVKVRDGDTVEVEAYIWPMQTVHTAVRLRGIDAPELKAKCDGERSAAEAARDRLIALLPSGRVKLTDIEGDKYFGRVLADLSTDGTPDIAAALKREGLVGAYGGGKRRDWCDGAVPGAGVLNRLLGRG